MVYSVIINYYQPIWFKYLIIIFLFSRFLKFLPLLFILIKNSFSLNKKKVPTLLTAYNEQLKQYFGTCGLEIGNTYIRIWLILLLFLFQYFYFDYWITYSIEHGILDYMYCQKLNYAILVIIIYNVGTLFDNLTIHKCQYLLKISKVWTPIKVFFIIYEALFQLFIYFVGFCLILEYGCIIYGNISFYAVLFG